MSDVSESAGRLRRLESGEGYHAVYGPEIPGRDRVPVDKALVLAAAIPLFDDTPITEEFANSLSRRQVSDEVDAVWVLGMSTVGRSVTLLHRHSECGEFWAVYMSGAKLQMIATVGQLRLLARALGIELRENLQ